MITNLIAQVLEAPLAQRERELDTRDAIVVLGARLAAGDVLTPALAERVTTAAALYRAGAAPRIVPTGGVTGRATRAEADAIADALVADGVPREAILVERESQTTIQNARYTARLLAPLGVRRVWLVTQPFHARRAVRVFRRAGLDADAWHIADSLQYRDRGRAVKWLAREWAAWSRELFRRDR